MSKKIITSMVALACSMSPVMVYSAESVQPNVLVIIMDDLGTGQLDFTLDSLEREALEKRQVAPRYQGDIAKMIDAAARSMPNVANLAHAGVKMTNAFVAHPVCGPSRAGIFTGRYPASFGTYSNDDASQGIPLDVTLLPKLFQDNGYATATIGKWHNAKVESKNLVPENTRTRDYHDNEVTVTSKGYEPNERGFDYSYSYYASGAALWNSPAIWVNGKNVPSQGYLTHNLTNEAIKFINN
ncbi:TPA: sulfatase-like hydrolase/transferase, partial [Aeromonas hydrophila]